MAHDNDASILWSIQRDRGAIRRIDNSMVSVMWKCCEMYSSLTVDWRIRLQWSRYDLGHSERITRHPMWVSLTLWANLSMLGRLWTLLAARVIKNLFKVFSFAFNWSNGVLTEILKTDGQEIFIVFELGLVAKCKRARRERGDIDHLKFWKTARSPTPYQGPTY